MARDGSARERRQRQSRQRSNVACRVTSILPLAFGMVPAEDVSAVGDKLVSTILDTDNGHLDTGIFGTRYLVDALASIGRIDVAMNALDQTSSPGFGYEIGHGATTDWEQWTYRSNVESGDGRRAHPRGRRDASNG